MHDTYPFRAAAAAAGDATSTEFYHHSSGLRVSTDAVIADSLRKQYPQLPLTIVPIEQFGFPCDLLSYAASGHATVTPMNGGDNDGAAVPLKWRYFLPPTRRLDGGDGFIADNVLFGKYMYSWEGNEFLLYVIDGRDGVMSYPQVQNQYVLGASEGVINGLIRACSKYAIELHEQIWVFDGGFWQKNAELYKSVDKASWDDVILDERMKKTIQDDVLRFFASRERYEKLRVPWKRGVIYYGPPGNGKTISIKAMMHTLYHLKDPVPTLYVRTLSSWGGPEYSIRMIFAKARQVAPCFLVFEDLDSIVSDNVRSYFLNEVDGLQSNDGVLMVGSTNHLDRLDPGISKRPSRFDRKYEFTKPNFEQRVQYCDYWRGKLADNKEIEFPAQLSKAIAGITDDFSFAFMQEAFVATLLTIAARDQVSASQRDGGGGGHDDDDGDKWEDLILWKEIQKQVKILREEM